MLHELRSDQWLALFTGFSMGFAILIRWLIYRSHRTVAPALDSLQLAYLLGGPQRAKEVAFFHLVRDGYLRRDAGNVFYVDEGADGPLDDLSAVERELQGKINEVGPLDVQKVLAMEVPALAAVENSLVHTGVMISREMRTGGAAAAFAPTLLCACAALVELLDHVDSATLGWSHLILFASFAVVVTMRDKFPRYTTLGDKVRDDFERSVRRRREEELAAGHGGFSSNYDRLWAIKDDILMDGFRALHGTAFLSPVPPPGARVGS